MGYMMYINDLIWILIKMDLRSLNNTPEIFMAQPSPCSPTIAMYALNSRNSVNSWPIWTIPSALETIHESIFSHCCGIWRKGHSAGIGLFFSLCCQTTFARITRSVLVSIMRYTSQRILYTAQSETEHVHNIKPLCPTRRLIRADASIWGTTGYT